MEINLKKNNNEISQDNVAFNGLTILTIVTLVNKANSKWIKFRATVQNAVSCIHPKHWSPEQVALGIIAQSYVRIHINSRV